MSDRTEQRICLRFCFRLGKTATEAHEMLPKAFKEEAPSRTQVFEWSARFKREEMSVEDHHHSGRPSTSYRQECPKNSTKNQRGSSVHNWRDLRSYRCGLELLSVDLNMRRVAAKFVPRLLTQDQRHTRLTLCQDLKNQTESDPNFLRSSSRAMKVGATGTILRPNKLRANGRRPLHRDRKKQDKWGQMWKRCSLLFFRCSRNRAPGIRSSWTDCQSGILLAGFEGIERKCTKKTPRIVEIGWLVSPSWQRPSSHSFVCDPVFGLSGMDCHSPPTLFTRPSPLWFLFIPDNEKGIERKDICHCGGGEKSFAGGIQQYQASAVPEMLHTVGKRIGQVYCLQWGVFWRGLSVFYTKCK